MPQTLRDALEPIMKSIEELTIRIRHYDKLIEKMCDKQYPETELLRKISGVGAVTALAYVLTLEEPSRFEKSRSVGAFLGVVPRRDKSGQTDKQLRITKAGDGYVRRLLVGSAQYILGPFGPDCDLRRSFTAMPISVTAMPLCRYFNSMSRVTFPIKMTRLKLAMACLLFLRS